MDERYIWIAEFRYGQPHLTKAKVLKEMSKTFQLEEVSTLLGLGVYVGWKRFSKEKSWFDSNLKAIQYLYQRCRESVAVLKTELTERKETLEFLSQLLKEAEKKAT